jgi:hypothetical protein
MRSPGDGLLIAPPRAEKVLSKLSLEFRIRHQSVAPLPDSQHAVRLTLLLAHGWVKSAS